MSKYITLLKYITPLGVLSWAACPFYILTLHVIYDYHERYQQKLSEIKKLSGISLLWNAAPEWIMSPYPYSKIE